MSWAALGHYPDCIDLKGLHGGEVQAAALSHTTGGMLLLDGLHWPQGVADVGNLGAMRGTLAQQYAGVSGTFNGTAGMASLGGMGPTPQSEAWAQEQQTAGDAARLQHQQQAIDLQRLNLYAQLQGTGQQVWELGPQQLAAAAQLRTAAPAILGPEQLWDLCPPYTGPF